MRKKKEGLHCRKVLLVGPAEGDLSEERFIECPRGFLVFEFGLSRIYDTGCLQLYYRVVQVFIETLSDPVIYPETI